MKYFCCDAIRDCLQFIFSSIYIVTSPLLIIFILNSHCCYKYRISSFFLYKFLIALTCFQANSRYQQKKRNAEGNEKNSEEMNNLTPPNGNETETTLPLPPPPSSMNTLTRTGTDFNELPQVPPHLHHSFNKGHVVPSESVVYTLPKTSHLQENTKTKLIGSIPEGGTFFESSTPFCLPGSRPCSTMDHPMVTAGYFETSSPPPYPQNNAALPGFQSRRPTVESMQSSPGGVLPDIPSTQKHYINRPDNHIYADIHPQP